MTAGEGTANAAAPQAAAQLKVVYAYAADRPDRFAGFKDALQADVAITERFLSAQSGGTKALRYDMGTRSGPQYADLRVVALAVRAPRTLGTSVRSRPPSATRSELRRVRATP